jgi:hypothetical protein
MLVGMSTGQGVRWDASWLVGCTWAHARAATYRYLLLIVHHHRVSSPSPRSIMSSAPSTSTSTLQSNFASIFNAALQSYKRKTKQDLPSHPLFINLEPCNSPEAVLTVLREQVPAFNQSQTGDEGLPKWVTPTVNVLSSFSETIGQGIGVVSVQRTIKALIFIFRHSHRQP